MKNRGCKRWPVKTAALVFLLGWSSGLLAQNFPQPPCAVTPHPLYAGNGMQPNVQVWGKASLTAWIPPPCTGWSSGASNLLVALAGTFSHTGSADDLLKRFGAVSAMRGIRYWSVTANVTEEQVQRAVDKLNHRPRKVLGFRSPHEILFGVGMRYTKPPLAVALRT